MSPAMFHEIDDFKNIGIDVLNPMQSNAKEKKKDGRENGSQSHGQDQSLV